MDFGYKTDVGSVRKLNEDNFLFNNTNDKYVLLAVADGMGGHNAGDVASADAIAYLKKFNEDMGFEKDIRSRIADCVNAINKFIYKQSLKNFQFAGMGTTLTAGVISGNELYVANVGDSRCYIFNNSGYKQVTTDHSYVQELVKLGRITSEEAKYHPEKNKLMQAIGTDMNVVIDLFCEELKKGDYVLICSDGLSNMVDEDDIRKILLSSETVQEAVDILVAKANQNGGTDNITLVAVKID